MSRNLLLGWAIAASVIALAALFTLGYLIGQSRAESAAPVPAATPTFSTSTADDIDSPVAEDTYSVPERFQGLPAEWRTVFNGQTDGYAILFDVARRELIVERCHHPGYIDSQSGRPVPDGWEFCTGVLWSSIGYLDETTAEVFDRQGRPVVVTLDLKHDLDVPRLGLEFGDHDMDLVPGSKNDLLQAMDRSPAMTAQRQRRVAMEVAGQLSSRRVAEEAARGAQNSGRVPVFVLPPEQEQDLEERRTRAETNPGNAVVKPEDLAEEQRRQQQEASHDPSPVTLPDDQVPDVSPVIRQDEAPVETPDTE